jgi:leader peptidase (prepilin peptidase)/N-methyltransferase
MDPQISLFFSKWFPFFLVLLFGLSLGSFLNVCILRIPKGQSIVRPASRCPRCKKSLKWWHNIPVISFLLLRGRCGFCGLKISWQYPLVELLTGLYFCFVFTLFQGDPTRLAFLWALGFLAILLSGIDIKTMTLPDGIVLPAMAVSAVLSPLNPWLGGDWQGRMKAVGLGFAMGGGILWVVAWAGSVIFKKEALGGGDIKLLAFLGMVLGWEDAVNGLFIASILGGLVGGSLLLSGRLKSRAPIPFGPFLFIGCLLYVFYPLLGLTYWVVDH